MNLSVSRCLCGICIVPSQFRTEPVENLPLNVGVVAKPNEPGDAGLAPKPGHLALGVLACCRLSFPHCVVLSDLPAQYGASLPVTEGFERLQPGPVGKLYCSAHLVQQAGAEHALDPAVDAFVEPGAVGVESDLHDVETVQTGRAALEHPGHRLARQQADFNGAKGLLLIAGVDPRRSGRVQAPEQAVEKLAAILSALTASAASIDAPSVPLGHRLKARAQAFRPPR